MIVPPTASFTEIAKNIDDLVRADFESFRDSWFNWLLFWTAVVAVGLLFEMPEIIHDSAEVIRDLFHSAKSTSRIAPWMKLLVSAGWLLIVVGVMGEFVADSFVSKADGMVTAFDETLLADTQRRTGLASERSASAFERAAQTEREASQENERAAKALQAAETARKEAEGFQLQIAQANGRAAEATERAEAERLARIELLKELQPRRLSGEQKKQLADILRDDPQPIFIGWCMNGADCMDFANDIGDALKQAKWTPTFAARFSSTYGVQVGFSKDSEPSLVARWTEKLRSAFSKIGVDCKIVSFDPADKTIPGGFERNVLYLTIENKPEPTGEP